MLPCWKDCGSFTYSPLIFLDYQPVPGEQEI